MSPLTSWSRVWTPSRVTCPPLSLVTSVTWTRGPGSGGQSRVSMWTRPVWWRRRPRGGGGGPSPPPVRPTTSGGSGWSRSMMRSRIWSRKISIKNRRRDSEDRAHRGLFAEWKHFWDLSGEHINVQKVWEVEIMVSPGERSVKLCIPYSFANIYLLTFQTISSWHGRGAGPAMCHSWQRGVWQRPLLIQTAQSPPLSHSSTQLQCSPSAGLMVGIIDKVLSHCDYGLIVFGNLS